MRLKYVSYRGGKARRNENQIPTRCDDNAVMSEGTVEANISIELCMNVVHIRNAFSISELESFCMFEINTKSGMDQVAESFEYF